MTSIPVTGGADPQLLGLGHASGASEGTPGVRRARTALVADGKHDVTGEAGGERDGDVVVVVRGARHRGNDGVASVGCSGHGIDDNRPVGRRARSGYRHRGTGNIDRLPPRVLIGGVIQQRRTGTPDGDGARAGVVRVDADKDDPIGVGRSDIDGPRGERA